MKRNVEVEIPEGEYCYIEHRYCQFRSLPFRNGKRECTLFEDLIENNKKCPQCLAETGEE